MAPYTPEDGQGPEPDSVVKRGEIFAYWEQGMEGRVLFAFQPEDSPQPIFLENGQHLTVYGEGGKVLWSGEINLVRVRFWDRHKLAVPIWSYTKQKGVPYGRWMEWFWRKPPLKARLEVRKTAR
ncbi:MAG: hypothetical protein D6759_12460 [Chloroflexi bacterium]|nr:MAG: hypothetical protein D6759_12460 [Chloroflexota bacterium]